MIKMALAVKTFYDSLNNISNKNTGYNTKALSARILIIPQITLIFDVQVVVVRDTGILYQH
jgi:hypothetical protein